MINMVKFAGEVCGMEKTQATKRPIQSPAQYTRFESRLNGSIKHEVFDIAFGEKGFSGSGGCLIAEAINKTQGEYIAKCINRANCHDELVATLVEAEELMKVISDDLCQCEESQSCKYHRVHTNIKQALAKAEAV